MREYCLGILLHSAGSCGSPVLFREALDIESMLLKVMFVDALFRQKSDVVVIMIGTGVNFVQLLDKRYTRYRDYLASANEIG